jgi:hypothetical protein
MAHQIVATSVPRGLDGVSGYQTVLKSAGIPPRVFDRLKARSGYSHRFPHGDRRNPVVYIHRIEDLAGSRWHVLGCIRDAGSDHTGRSNFLAHMLAIDSAEARGKPGGPAAAALVRGCFLDKWDRPPDPSAPAKTLVVSDRPPQPGESVAWRAAGLDPGLAGDLAAAAMANRKLVLITRPEDDVLALFADALRLVEPAKRWGVTFNTCAIEDFDGTWKAVRADLADAKDLRDSKAILIDLTSNPLGSADAYAKFARGEADTLPWQKVIAVPQPVAEDHSGTDDAVAASRTKPDVSSREPRKNYAGKATAATQARERREQRPRYEEEPQSPVSWQAVTIGAIGMLLIGILIVIPFRDQLFDLVQPKPPRSLEPPVNVVTTPSKPPALDAKDDPEYRQLAKVNDVRTRLTQGIDGTTHDALRDEATALLKRIDDLRDGQGGGDRLRVMRKDDSDPRREVEKVIETCHAVANILATTSSLSLGDLTNAENDFKAAVENLAGLQSQVDAIAEAELKEIHSHKAAADEKAEEGRRNRAFVEFQSLGKAVSLPGATARADIEGDSRPAANGMAIIDLGSFKIADLVEPSFRLAVPRETIEGSVFKADIVTAPGEGDPRWEIRYLPSAVSLDGGHGSERPRPLAYLVARDSRLMLEIPRSNETGLQTFSLLRRSVILVEAKDPASQTATALTQQIRLVQPTTIKPLAIDLFAERQQELKIVPPAGITRTVRGPTGPVTLAIPVESLRLELDFPKGNKLNLELPKDVREGTEPGIGDWIIPLADLARREQKPQIALNILADIRLSLPQATLTVRTYFDGQDAKLYDKTKVNEIFIAKDNEELKDRRRAFDARIKAGTGFGFVAKQTKPKDIMAWFDKPLASGQRLGLSLPMPAHETAKKSFETYLKQAPKESGLPKDWETFREDWERSKDEKEWKQRFTDRITEWSTWFWPQFQAEWEAKAALFRGVLAERHTISITGIISLAYDDRGNVFEVPLVVLDDKSASTTPLGPGTSQKAESSVGLD